MQPTWANTHVAGAPSALPISPICTSTSAPDAPWNSGSVARADGRDVGDLERELGRGETPSVGERHGPGHGARSPPRSSPSPNRAGRTRSSARRRPTCGRTERGRARPTTTARRRWAPRRPWWTGSRRRGSVRQQSRGMLAAAPLNVAGPRLEPGVRHAVPGTRRAERPRQRQDEHAVTTRQLLPRLLTRVALRPIRPLPPPHRRRLPAPRPTPPRRPPTALRCVGHGHAPRHPPTHSHRPGPTPNRPAPSGRRGAVPRNPHLSSRRS